MPVPPQPCPVTLTQPLQHHVRHSHAGAVGDDGCQSRGEALALGADVAGGALAQPRRREAPVGIAAGQQHRWAALQVDAGIRQCRAGGRDDGALQRALRASCGAAPALRPHGRGRQRGQTDGGRQGRVPHVPEVRYLGRARGDISAPRGGGQCMRPSWLSCSSGAGPVSRRCRSCGNRGPRRPTPSTPALQGRRQAGIGHHCPPSTRSRVVPHHRDSAGSPPREVPCRQPRPSCFYWHSLCYRD